MCVYGKPMFGLLLSVKFKDKSGEIHETSTCIHRGLDGPDITTAEEMKALLNLVKGQDVEILDVGREFRQVGGYV